MFCYSSLEQSKSKYLLGLPESPGTSYVLIHFPCSAHCWLSGKTLRNSVDQKSVNRDERVEEYLQAVRARFWHSQIFICEKDMWFVVQNSAGDFDWGLPGEFGIPEVSQLAVLSKAHPLSHLLSLPWLMKVYTRLVTWPLSDRP